MIEADQLPPGEHGTVFMKLGQADFEYHKDKEKTRKSRRGEYFTVGDIGYLNEDGYLFLCDRKSDMIISGGVNIYPAEIENVLLTHPKIADVAVFGIPHPDWGEEVKAVVELVPDTPPSDDLRDDIFEFLRKPQRHKSGPHFFGFERQRHVGRRAGRHHRPARGRPAPAAGDGQCPGQDHPRVPQGLLRRQRGRLGGAGGQAGRPAGGCQHDSTGRGRSRAGRSSSTIRPSTSPGFD